MSKPASIRQGPSPRLGRRIPWGLKVTTEENAALEFIGRVRGMEPQDLVRECSINDVVSEYRMLAARVAAAN